MHSQPYNSQPYDYGDDRGNRKREREHHSSNRRERERERDSDPRRERERERDSKPDVKREPSPPRRQRKRVSLWDKAPTGFNAGTLQPQQPIPQSALNPHQSRQARRLYVGNIPANVTDAELAEFFNTAMYAAGATKGANPSPVIAVQMNHEKSFAFIEFTCMEDASAGMGFDGITLQGHALKVRRPKDYKELPPPKPEKDKVKVERQEEREPEPSLGSNIVSTNVQEGPNKIFIGGLPSYLNEEQVKQLIGAFGPLKSFNLVKDSATGISKGFAFFDYQDPNVTDKACQGLNGMKIGEKSVLVQRANVGAKHVPAPNPNAEGIIHNPTAHNFLNLQMPIAAAVALLGLNINDGGPPTRILQLMNLITPEELLKEDEYQALMEDVKDEMRKFGTVISVQIPRPPKPKPKVEDSLIQDAQPALPTEVNWGVGRVFVEFKRKEEAEKAQKTLGGRRYNNRAVLTGYYSEEKYANKDWTPDAQEEFKVAEKFKKYQEQKEQEDIEKIRRAIQEDLDEMEAQEKLNQQNTER